MSCPLQSLILWKVFIQEAMKLKLVAIMNAVINYQQLKISLNGVVRDKLMMF